MIWRTLLTVMCLVMPVMALANPAVTALITPSPLGVVLTVGHWIMTQDRPTYYIEVEGRGRSPEEARSNCYRLAVEQAVGSLISSESQVENGRLRRDEIITYASGYVTKHEVMSTAVNGAGDYKVKMKVWVARSALSDRLLNRSEQSGQVDGARASVQLQTLNYERATGDAILQQVLNDFPQRAFDIEMRPTDVIRHNRSAHMELTFVLKWNKDYLRSLWTALEATSFRGSKPVSIIGVNSGSIFGFGGQARFDDMQKYRMIVNTFVGSGPALLVTVNGGNKEVLFKSCYYYQELDHITHYHVSQERFLELTPYVANAFVDGSYRMKSRIQIPINPALIQHATTVDMHVVTKNQCPNR